MVNRLKFYDGSGISDIRLFELVVLFGCITVFLPKKNRDDNSGELWLEVFHKITTIRNRLSLSVMKSYIERKVKKNKLEHDGSLL